MPNWCNNHLTVTGDADALRDFIAKSIKQDKKGEDYLTFQGVFPRPKELDITSGSSTDNAITLLNARKKDFTQVDEYTTWENWAKIAKIKPTHSQSVKRIRMVEYLSKSISKRDIREGKQALRNEQLYGCKDWYNWNIANWGTKWDAYDSYIGNVDLNELTVEFDTAWSPPIGWVERCEEMYPLLTFSLDYEESGMGFAGTYCQGINVDRECTPYEEESNEN